MTRKPPKRVGDAEPAPLSTDRLLELTEVVTHTDYTVGPLDQEDLQKALNELVYRRGTERAASQQHQEAAA